MHKFFILMKNEWKKLLRRKAVWIMGIILFVVAIGFALLAGAVSEYDYSYDATEDWRSSLLYYEEMAKETDSEGNPTEYALSAKEMALVYKKQLEVATNYSDWRIDSGLIDRWANVKMHPESEENRILAEKYEKIIDENDAKEYFKDFYGEKKKADPENAGFYQWALDYCLSHDCIPSLSSDDFYALADKTLDAKIEAKAAREMKVAGVEIDEERFEEIINKEAVLSYQADHDILTNPADSFHGTGSFLSGMIFGLDMEMGDNVFWNTLSESSWLFMIIAVFVVILGGSILSNEFMSGTMRFLLMTPAKRGKILGAKYVTVFLAGIGYVLVLFIGVLIGLFCMHGFSDLVLPGITATHGVVRTVSPFGQLLATYLLSGVEILLMMTMAFAISSATKNTAVAIAFSLFLYEMGYTVVLLLKVVFQCDWARYLLFANTNFSAIASGNTIFPHQSLGTAIVIVVLHMVVFLLTAWDGFVRRDV